MRCEVRITLTTASGTPAAHAMRLHLEIEMRTPLSLAALVTLLRGLGPLLEAFERRGASGTIATWYVSNLTIVESAGEEGE